MRRKTPSLSMLALTGRLLLAALFAADPVRVLACSNEPDVMPPFEVNEDPVWQTYFGLAGTSVDENG